MAIRDNLKGGSSKKLYDALQYSGLVTEDMTYNEMCEILKEYFPEAFKLYMSSANEGAFDIFQKYNSNGTLTFGNEMTLSQTTGLGSKTKIYSKEVDLTNYKKLHFEHVSSAARGNTYSWIVLTIDKAKKETAPTATLPKDLDTSNSVVIYKLLDQEQNSNSGEVNIDVSGLSGKHYVSVEISSNVADALIQTKISNMYMTGMS